MAEGKFGKCREGLLVGYSCDRKENFGKSFGTFTANIATSFLSSVKFLSRIPLLTGCLLVRRKFETTSQIMKEQTAQVSSTLIKKSKPKSSPTTWKDYAGHNEIKPLLQQKK